MSVKKEVEDILYMFRWLIMSYDALDDKADVPREKVLFYGFDLTREPQHYDKVLKQKTNIEHAIPLRYCPSSDLNSGCLKVDTYKRMLKEYRKLGSPQGLNGREIAKIVAAQIAPENR